MKKEFKKKLSLNKETIERLNSELLNGIKGGYEELSGAICPESGGADTYCCTITGVQCALRSAAQTATGGHQCPPY
jgi:hypothetical protein